MPVAHVEIDGKKHGPRNIHAPAEASLKGWWNSARKAFLVMPRWVDVRDSIRGSYDEDTITFHWHGGDVFIARKRRLM